MPKYRVYKGHDAYVRYVGIIEADNIEAANEKMTWKTERNQVNWKETGDITEFDASDFFPDETELVEEDDNAGI